MRIRQAPAVAAAALLMTNCHAVAAEPAGVGIIPLDLSGPRPVADLVLAGGASGKAIFDTGAAASVLKLEFADRAGLAHEGGGNASGPGGQPIPGYRTTIAGRLGGVGFPASLAVALDIPLPLPGISAVISPSVFSGRLVRFDFAASRAEVLERTPANIPRDPPSDYRGANDAAHINRTPTVDVTLPDGSSLPASLDTGSATMIELPMEASHRVSLAGPLRPGPPVRMLGIERKTMLGAVIGVVRVGAIAVKDPEVTFVEGVDEGKIGMAFLRHTVVVLDPSAYRDWLLPARD